jgi:predicted peptidase
MGGESYSYQVYVPAKLQGKEKLPVILFLHGIGQRGEGGYLPVSGAAATFARGYLEQVPAIILLPQCRKGLYWSDPKMERMVSAALDQTVAEFHADNKRLYLTGVSMGGFGAWGMAAQSPEKFAAVVAICGGSPLRTGDRFTPIARRVKSTPVWVFHGEDDKVVPVSESRRMVAALKAVGGNRVRYSEYKGVGHNVWLNALSEKELMPWILAQHLD